MDMLILTLGAFDIFCLFMMMFKFLEFKQNVITLSKWPIFFIFGCALTMIITITSAYIDDALINADYVPFWVMLSILFIYCPYCFVMFRYGYNDDAWFWFNGLYIKRIKSKEIDRIVFIKKKGKVLKFGFQLKNKLVKMRNDLGIEDVVSNFGRLNRIPIIKKSY